MVRSSEDVSRSKILMSMPLENSSIKSERRDSFHSRRVAECLGIFRQGPVVLTVLNF